MLDDVLAALACPHCGAGLTRDGRILRCAGGHAFDIARQGYVSLLAGDAKAGTADTAAMVEARAAFLGAGHYAGLAGRITAAAGAAELVADVGAGTGYYLAHLLDRVPDAAGVAIDVSKFALRRAARAHDRLGAVVADAWRRLPLRDGAVDVALNVFAPRNSAELRRILAPDGRLVVVTPGPGHLGELVGRLGLLRVDEDKDARLRDQLGADFTLVAADRYEERLPLDRADVRALVLMGPSAWHVDPAAIDVAVAELPEPFPVTLSATVWIFRPRPGCPQGANTARS
jgi:23S rRNA (guanine745-N1)-methyltransferase